MNLVFIAVGSNLEDPEMQITQALDALAKIGQLTNLSHWYSTPPMGPQNQADFINGAILLATSKDPFTLLKALQTIEQNQNRIHEKHWGPRTIDLDIALFNNSSVFSRQLIIPHQGMITRDFVLQPILDIAPNQCLPSGESLASLLRKLPKTQLTPLNAFSKALVNRFLDAAS